MRARAGHKIMIQYAQAENTIRYECIISTVSDQLIQTTIDSQVSHLHRQNTKHLIVAMTNKRDKMELIVQKATECGVSHITIVPMHRSIIRTCNINKWKRLEAIMLEAVEQSRSINSPLLQRCDDITSLSNSESP
jgi:16S rRNA (uracil1498-N3)-methyltransferase